MDDPERASRGGWVFDAPEPVFGCRDLRRARQACGRPALQRTALCLQRLCPGHAAAPLLLLKSQWILPPHLLPLAHAPSARGVYDAVSPGFRGRCTAPLLVDRVAQRAVCNESSIIARNLAQLARPHGGGGGAALDLVPAQLLPQIDAWNDRIYETGAGEEWGQGGWPEGWS